MNKKHCITIREAYKDYKPPFDVVATVNRLLNGIPPKYLAGLKTVVVSSSQNLSKKVRKAKAKARGKSYELGKRRGSYHQKWKNEPAWITLLVDNMLRHWQQSLFHFTFFRDIAVSETLFHEIGHHIHDTRAPEYREKEDVADKWGRRLSRHYFRRRYWYLLPLFLLLRFTLKPLEVLRNRKKS